jgi:hypothetical protein
MDEAELATVCLQVAKPMKKVVRKTFEEAVFLVSFLSVTCMCCNKYIIFMYVFCTERFRKTAHRKDEGLISQSLRPCCLHGASAASAENFVIFGRSRKCW